MPRNRGGSGAEKSLFFPLNSQAGKKYYVGETICKKRRKRGTKARELLGGQSKPNVDF